MSCVKYPKWQIHIHVWVAHPGCYTNWCWCVCAACSCQMLWHRAVSNFGQCNVQLNWTMIGGWLWHGKHLSRTLSLLMHRNMCLPKGTNHIYETRVHLLTLQNGRCALLRTPITHTNMQLVDVRNCACAHLCTPTVHDSAEVLGNILHILSEWVYHMKHDACTLGFRCWWWEPCAICNKGQWLVNVPFFYTSVQGGLVVPNSCAY